MGKAGASFFCVCFLDRNAESFSLADENDPVLAARDGGIDQRPCQHERVRALQIDDDRAVFTALRLVNEKLNPPAMLGRLEEDVSGMRK